MKILITNDDGIDSKGLHILAREMEKENEVIVAAPSSQRSACSHSITIHDPLFIKEMKVEGINSRIYSVSGTPADCVKIGIEKLADGNVDMVLSGINYGLNIGTDVIYSGTVSAAVEGAIYKIPAMAVSMDTNNSEEALMQGAKYANYILKTVFANHIKKDMVININMPERLEEGIEGLKICQLGNRIYTTCYIETMAKEGRIAYELNSMPLDEEVENTDVYFIKKRFITITPLHYDLTNFKVLKDVEKWFSTKKFK